MSYDLSVRADENYSKSTAKQPLIEFMATLPNLRVNGLRGFVLDDPPKRWMEIDLEVVSGDGDNIEEPDQEYPELNCLRLHIPYGFFAKGCFDRNICQRRLPSRVT
jgi:hypothetical protein